MEHRAVVKDQAIPLRQGKGIFDADQRG
jgi:hypothetical protein